MEVGGSQEGTEVKQEMGQKNSEGRGARRLGERQENTDEEKQMCSWVVFLSIHLSYSL